ncbi:SDR family NAD(P)-dependent oxidoreductase [Ferrimonas sp. SCSIO 43195]|uniref:SDR family NAD(P)-dependent oxidoreductase n=1 Tax=Ferrimonas sp. SCSIO 43195 TaxID=2822844 RepID=UPI002074C34E|nr:SDR family NAD(P)-dependent oxidoreductase [Ferrimonas sp. SCSIO 43195]USD35822.1 SDR family NAD(P)-dependent oxidoreductase [Ferrimonas sp. SCSIO 43195]
MKRVVITGATSGIGKQLAKDYAKDGWQVFACGRNAAALAELDQHPNISVRQFDLTNAEQTQAQLANLPELNLAILNAGTCEYIDDARQFDGALLARVMTANVIGVGYCLQALLPQLASGSRLALMGSIASTLPLPRAEAYGASKAAIAYLAQTLAIDLAGSDIGVSLITPGFVRTPLTDKNQFDMPMRIEVEDASERIRRDLARGRRQIHFPKRFTLALKLFGALPQRLWHSIALKGLKQ